MTLSETCQAAARLLSRKGWIQGHYAIKGGKTVCAPTRDADCFCILGALRAVRPDVFGVVEALSKETVPLTLAQWNDTPGRTKREVLEFLRRPRE